MHQINWTQLFGLTAFGLAGVSHCLAAVQTPTKQRQSRRWWLILSALYILICFELIENFRHDLLNYIGITMSLGEHYNERQPIQIIALFVIASSVIWLIFVLRNAQIIEYLGWALIAGVCTICLFMLEVVSLHQMDAVLYQPAGPVLLIGWLWLLCGLAATAIAFKASFKVRSHWS